MSTDYLNYINLVDSSGNYSITKGEKGGDGEKGDSGVDGSKGQKGVGGATGATGQKGNAGIAGIPGLDGAKGQKGGAASAFSFEGVHPQVADLPASGNSAGDVRHVLATGHFHVYDGTSWVSLNSGTTVVKGQKGADSSKGQKGQKGAEAAKGAKGLSGSTGVAGDKGATGDTGAKGQKGVSGPTGSKGVAGDKGSAGSNGTDGSDGDKGEKGITGASGPIGATGATGDKGDKGSTGSTGSKGDQGVGAEGAKGDKGSAAQQKGDAGAKGDAGDKGEPGTDGIDGSDGEKGEPGAKGATGPSGGEKGSKGAKGNPAIVPNNFSGSIIPNNSTVAQAFQALETAVEGRANPLTANIFQGEQTLRDRLSIDPGDGGLHLQINRNVSSTQMDILLRDPPSGARLNLNTVNAHGDDALIVYSSKFWCRALGGGTGDAEFDGNVTVDGSLSVGGVAISAWSDLADDVNVDHLQTLTGVGAGSEDFGQFDGSTLADNQNLKQILQALENKAEANTTAVGNKADLIAFLALQSDVNQNEADADAAIALRATIADTVMTGTTRANGVLHVGDDGLNSGYYLKIQRNGNTQLDLLARNIPSGGNLNITNSNGNNARVVVYSDEFWVRALGGSNGNGKARFDGDVSMKLSSSVTPVNNNDLMIEATNDTTLTFKLKGSDGTVRSGTITLS